MANLRKIRLELELDEPTGIYTVTSPDVPGLVTEGSTPQEILANVEEAIECLLEGWARNNMEIPEALRGIIRQLGISREEFGPIR
jgi:predicted RNase H-like HicB family nuclease